MERGCPSVTLTEHAVMARTGSGSNRVRACVPGTAHHDPFAFYFLDYFLSPRPPRRFLRAARWGRHRWGAAVHLVAARAPSRIG